jgi:DNA recombination protein RmuC
LYDKFAGFVVTLEAVGRNIEGAQKSYDKAFEQLKTGKGSLVSRSENLRRLGIKASKKLSASLTDSTDEDSEESAQNEESGEVTT